jgi:hypothetical protein
VAGSTERQLRDELADLRDDDSGTEQFVRQAVAVVDGEREAIDAAPPATDYPELVALVVEQSDVGDMLAAGTAVATTDGVEPEPLADFTGRAGVS